MKEYYIQKLKAAGKKVVELPFMPEGYYDYVIQIDVYFRDNCVIKVFNTKNGKKYYNVEYKSIHNSWN